MLHQIATCPKVAAIHPVTSQHFKLSHIDIVKENVEEISRLLHPYINEKNPFQEPIESGDIQSTLSHVTKKAAENQDVVLVCGSFYIMADVRDFFKFGDDLDPKEVNLA